MTQTVEICPETRPPKHGLVAVYIPRTDADEKTLQLLRAELGATQIADESSLS